VNDDDPCIVASDKQVYEINGLRPDGTCHGGAVCERDTDDEAKALATAYAALWEMPVELHRVPAVNMSGTPSEYLWPDEVKFIARIEPPPEKEGRVLAAELRAYLDAKFNPSLVRRQARVNQRPSMKGLGS
jgi:hypothetical protein